MTTETLIETRPAPVEPTTPIKPSEAIRLGCLLAPVQAHASMFGDEGEGPVTGMACALGAMLLGYGWDGQSDGQNEYDAAKAILGNVRISHPRMGPTEPFFAIYALNDDGWTRERIADWLAEQGL